MVGTRPVRPDGVDKVTGRARFGADLRLPACWSGTILRSPHAHAKHQEDRHLEGARSSPA